MNSPVITQIISYSTLLLSKHYFFNLHLVTEGNIASVHDIKIQQLFIRFPRLFVSHFSLMNTICQVFFCSIQYWDMQGISNKRQLLEDYNYWYITQWLTYAVIYLSLSWDISFLSMWYRNIFFLMSVSQNVCFFYIIWKISLIFLFLRNICMADLSFSIMCVSRLNIKSCFFNIP